jgi:hypothetical protein
MIKLIDEGLSQAEIDQSLGFPCTTVKMCLKTNKKFLLKLKCYSSEHYYS